MMLSNHFSLEELTFSQAALRIGIDNTPPPEYVSNLKRLCADLLEPARELLNCPLHIDSGFRCSQLNALIHGAIDSAHLYGRAADCIPIGLDLHDAFNVLRKSSLPYDQIIIECGAWIHMSIPISGLPPRKQMLAATGTPGNWKYESVA